MKDRCRYVQTDIIGALYTPTHKTWDLIEINTYPARFTHRGYFVTEVNQIKSHGRQKIIGDFLISLSFICFEHSTLYLQGCCQS